MSFVGIEDESTAHWDQRKMNQPEFSVSGDTRSCFVVVGLISSEASLAISIIKYLLNNGFLTLLRTELDNLQP